MQKKTNSKLAGKKNLISLKPVETKRFGGVNVSYDKA